MRAPPGVGAGCAGDAEAVRGDRTGRVKGRGRLGVRYRWRAVSGRRSSPTSTLLATGGGPDHPQDQSEGGRLRIHGDPEGDNGLRPDMGRGKGCAWRTLSPPDALRSIRQLTADGARGDGETPGMLGARPVARSGPKDPGPRRLPRLVPVCALLGAVAFPACTALMPGGMGATAVEMPPIPVPGTPEAVRVSSLPPIPFADGDLRLEIGYPAEEATLAVRDRNFLFGSTGSGRARLTVNGAPVEVTPNGGFLAFLPVPPDGVYRLAAERGSGRLVLRRPRNHA